MRRPLLLLALTASSLSQASTFFLPCEAALKTPPFKTLQAFYASRPELAEPESCFRLNDREFLVTVSNAGRRAEGLHHFDAESGAYGLVDATFSPALRVRHEFDGPNRKHFALLESSDMHAGDWINDYSVLFLTPKTNGRVFSRQFLVDTVQGESGLCPGNPTLKLASSLASLQIDNEGTDQVTLVFTIRTQRCPKGTVTQILKRFGWDGQRFVAR